jgi:hypothetical protein
MFVMNQYCPKRSDIVESMLATVEMNPLHRHPSMRHEIVVVVKTTNVDRQRPNHGIDGIDGIHHHFYRKAQKLKLNLKGDTFRTSCINQEGGENVR